MGYYVQNPRRRRRRRRRNPARRVRYRRNQMRMRGMQTILNQIVLPAATAGAGALALDILWGFIPIPVEMKTGPMRHVAKGIGAIALGSLAGMVTTRRTGDMMALGALTVTFHAAFREMTAQFMPQLMGPGSMGYYSAGPAAGYDPQLGYYVASPNMMVRGGESMPANNEMGYYVQEGAGAQY